MNEHSVAATYLTHSVCRTAHHDARMLTTHGLASVRTDQLWKAVSVRAMSRMFLCDTLLSEMVGSPS